MLSSREVWTYRQQSFPRRNSSVAIILGIFLPIVERLNFPKLKNKYMDYLFRNKKFVGELPREELRSDTKTKFPHQLASPVAPNRGRVQEKERTHRGENPRVSVFSSQVTALLNGRVFGVWKAWALISTLGSYSFWVLEYLFLCLWSGRGCLSCSWYENCIWSYLNARHFIHIITKEMVVLPWWEKWDWKSVRISHRCVDSNWSQVVVLVGVTEPAVWWDITEFMFFPSYCEQNSKR